MTSENFRRIALSFPETTESAHMDHPDFRVRGKIFATLGYPGEDFAMVKLTRDQQQVFVEAEPAIFEPVKGGWGRRGATNVHLRVAKQATARRALATAWGNAAPRRLSQEFESRR